MLYIAGTSECLQVLAMLPYDADCTVICMQLCVADRESMPFLKSHQGGSQQSLSVSKL